jgi:hypothetical protein
MSRAKALAFLLSGVMLASCGDRDSTVAANDAAGAEANAESASPPDGGQANGSQAPGVEAVPPPDAVSHPNGFLPYGEDPPAPSAPEPADGASGSSEPPPATEDEYIRNKQAGRRN